MQHILVVDDDVSNAKLLRFVLEDEGYRVTTTASPTQALEYIERSQYDLIVLDIVMPEMNGLELCRRIRTQSNTPILFLSGLNETTDKVTGLKLGADDYLTKPYDANEVLARTWALLRRSAKAANGDASLKNSDLELDLTDNQVTLARTGTTIRLTPSETRLLRFLVSNAGRSLSRDTLAIKVWGYDYDPQSNQVDVYISRLRNKIEEDPGEPRLIQTVRGLGYRFQPSGTRGAPTALTRTVTAD